LPSTIPRIEAPPDRLRYLLELQRRAEKIKQGVSRYYDDPVGFAADCIDWRDDGGLTEYQEDIIGSLSERKRVAVRGPHGLGKSTIASVTLLWFALTRDAAGVDWKAVATAGAWRQLINYLFPEVHKWAGRLRWEKVRDRPFSKAELLNLNLRLAHGAAFAAACTNPALIEGAHADSLLFIYDEAKAIPAGTFDACEGAFSGTGEALSLALSTPGSPSGRFYDIHARRPGYEDWFPRHVTLDEAIDAGRISETWADQRARQWGDSSAIFQNRVLGEFHAGDEDSVIPLSWAEAAVERWHNQAALGDMDAIRPRTVGVDVARSGEDRTVLAIRNGPVVTELRRSVKEDTMQTVGRVKGILEADPSRTAVVDVIGIGAGVVDRLREQHMKVVAFNAAGKSVAKDSTREFGFTNCLTGDARVAPIGNLLRIYRSRHDGPLFRIKTASGDEFTATPNHNVLTLRGWVAIKSLHVGDKLCDASGGKRSPASQPEVSNMPPTLSEIYRAARSRLEPERMHAGNVDFHGDRPVGEVEVITIDRDLLAVDPARWQECLDFELGGLLHREVCLPSQSRLTQGRQVGDKLDARSDDRGGVIDAQVPGCHRSPVRIRELASSELVGVGVVPDGNAALAEDAVHAVSGGPECAQDVVERFAGRVPAGDGVLIDIRDDEGEGLRPSSQRNPVRAQDAPHDVFIDGEALAETVDGLAVEVTPRHRGFIDVLRDGQGCRLRPGTWLDAVLGEDPVSGGPCSPEELAERCHRLASKIPLDEIVSIELTSSALHGDPFVYTLETSTGAYRTSSIVQRNCRSEAWWKMREALDPSSDPDVCLPDDEMLLGDLSAPQWSVTSTGKIQVESKDDIRKRLGRSTDDGDAVIQAFAPHLGEHKANARTWAGSADLARIGSAPHSRRDPRASSAPEPADAWDADSFAPQSDVPQRRRSNVRTWR
jgi:hypothetical protein